MSAWGQRCLLIMCDGELLASGTAVLSFCDVLLLDTLFWLYGLKYWKYFRKHKRSIFWHKYIFKNN